MRDIAIKRGQVYGMRCSGTNYLDGLLFRNFPDLFLGSTAPEVQKTFGWKHGDVGTTTYLHQDGKLKEVELMPLDWAKSRDTILFVIHRNPFSWLRSLHCGPHQAPEAYWQNFEDFIRMPFRSFHCNPPGSDSHPDKSVRLRQVKQKNMIESYDSVLDMRETKLKIFGSFKHRFQNVVYINLETLEQDPERYLREIADVYKLTMKPKFEDVNTYKGGDTPYVKSHYDPVVNKNLQHILSNLSWEDEQQVGYSLRVGAKLLARQVKVQAEPESLLNIFPYKQYYKDGHLLAPYTTATAEEPEYQMAIIPSLSH